MAAKALLDVLLEKLAWYWTTSADLDRAPATSVRAYCNTFSELCDVLRESALSPEDGARALERISVLQPQPHFRGQDLYGLSMESSLSMTIESLKRGLTSPSP